MSERRERDDRISKLMGSYLLKGYTLLDDYCQTCQTPLMRSRNGTLYCITCNEIDTIVRPSSEPTLTNDIIKPQMTESSDQTDTNEDVCRELPNNGQTDVNEDNGHSLSNNTSLVLHNLRDDIEKSKVKVQNKLRWASNRLESTHSIKACIELCTLIRECADTLKDLYNLDHVSMSQKKK